MNATAAQPDVAVGEPEALRAATYRLLANLISRAPSAELLLALTQIAPGNGERAIDQAWLQLRQAARDHDAVAWSHEYNALFVGIGEGEMTPYGSWYQTGRVMDKPLAKLRGALRMLGIERQPDAREPEDHVGGICEILALLAEDPGVSIEAQREFFRAHVRSWLPRFFSDLDKAPSADAYRAVAALGSAVLALDHEYLEMLA